MLTCVPTLSPHFILYYRAMVWSVFDCPICLVLSSVPGVKGLHADPQCLDSAHQTITPVS